MMDIGWTQLSDRMPCEAEHSRVLIFTGGYDFNGAQFFEVETSSLNENYYSNDYLQPEVCRKASHWSPLPDVWTDNKEAEHLRQECNLLADVLRDAYEVIKTVEGENIDEDERLLDLRMTIAATLSGYDKERIAKATRHEAAERIERIENALRLVAEATSIDRARAIADEALKQEAGK